MSGSLRVALLGSCAPKATSGVSRVLHNLGEQLGLLGVSVQKGISDPSRVPSEAAQQRRVQAILKSLERFRPHVIHVEVSDPVIDAVVRIARAADVPTSMGFHELHRYTSSPHEARVVLRKLIRQTRGYDLTIVENQEQETFLQVQEARRVVRLPRGVDLERFSMRHRDEQLRAAWRAASSPSSHATRSSSPVALWVGRLVPQKNPQWLIAALNEARKGDANFCAVIVGEGPERKALQSALPWVTFTGALSGSELERVYASADLFICPTPLEGYGNVFSEALASGLPVVAIDQAGSRDRLRHDVNALLVAPGDIGGFTTALLRLINDHTLRQRLADAAASSIAAFSWPIVARRYAETFTELAQQYAGARCRALGLGRSSSLPVTEQIAQTSLPSMPSPLESHNTSTAEILTNAIAHSSHILRQQPRLVSAWQQQGQQLDHHGDGEGAEYCYRRAEIFAPLDADIHRSLGQCLWRRGRWRAGWDHMMMSQRSSVSHLQPVWDGADPKDRRLLLYADGSLGEALQNLRFIPTLLQWGAHITVAVPEAWMWLCRALLPMSVSMPVTVVPLTGILPAYDMCFPLGYLIGPLGAQPDSLPELPKISLENSLEASQKNTPTISDGRLKIGICWQCDEITAAQKTERHSDDHDVGHDLAWGSLAPLAQIDGVRWIALTAGNFNTQQVPAWMETASTYRSTSDNYQTQEQRMTETCAIISQLDLIISVDSSIADLAAAYHRPTWVMLPKVAHWRWLTDRDDSPWSPMMRLYRQKIGGDWLELLLRLKEDILKYRESL